MIAELSKDNRWVKIQPPATEKDILDAESVVGYAFPDELKQLLYELNGDSYLILSAEEIINNCLLNREYLKECYEDIDFHIFFAGNGCGDYYCYRVLENGETETRIVNKNN